MEKRRTSNDTILDYITGEVKANAGSEANRQIVERLLVEIKGYLREDIEVDAPIDLEIDGRAYHSTVDLVLQVNGKRFAVIKCAAGALVSREREAIAAARLLENYQIPIAVATDGKDAVVWNTVSGKCIGEGMEAIPTRLEAEKALANQKFEPLDAKRRIQQALIFRSYDSMNVHKMNK